MELLTKQHHEQMIKNGALISKTGEDSRLHPVVKLFTPDAACTWLLVGLDPENPDIAYGLCDIGLGYVEFGSVSMTELRTLRGTLGLPVERDLHFHADKPVIDYAKAAWNAPSGEQYLCV